MRLPGHFASIAPTRRFAPILVAVIVCLGLSTQAGCLGLLSNLMHAAGADKTPAAYEGLEDCRVAVVTLTENSAYSDDVSARILGNNVMQRLRAEIGDIELVRADKIANWRDTHGWDQVEFDEIGRGVDADKVLAVEVTNLKLREGATLYQGHADVHISVVDAKTGDILWSRDIDDFTYPKTTGVYTNETSEVHFRKMYLGILAKRVARNFYPFDARDDFALDSVIAR